MPMHQPQTNPKICRILPVTGANMLAILPTNALMKSQENKRIIQEGKRAAQAVALCHAAAPRAAAQSPEHPRRSPTGKSLLAFVLPQGLQVLQVSRMMIRSRVFPMHPLTRRITLCPIAPMTEARPRTLHTNASSYTKQKNLMATLIPNQSPVYMHTPATRLSKRQVCRQVCKGCDTRTLTRITIESIK